MSLALALLSILVIASQILPVSLAVDKGPAAADHGHGKTITKHQRESIRHDDLLITNSARGDSSDVGAFKPGDPTTTKTLTLTVTTPATCTPVSFAGAANFGTGVTSVS